MNAVITGLLIPFVGTSAGAACVFFLKKDLKRSVQRALTGFAAGVMVAASIWSLIVPAIEQSSAMGQLAFLPAFLGFWAGILFLLLLDHVIPHLHRSIDQTEGPKSHLTRTAMMVLAVTLHNIPEGMAVGVVYAGLLSGSGNITAGGALALALGSPLMLFSLAMASTIRAEGIILPGMISNMAGTVTNLLLDPLFILSFKMGVAGAALATVLGNLVSSVMLVFAMRKHASLMAFSPRYALRKPVLLLHILAVGLPNGISSILSGLASTFSNRLLNAYGSGAIAAMAAAGRSVLVITMVQMGICIGVSPLLAYNYGARDSARLRESLQKTALLTAGFGFLSAAGCWLGREHLLALFLKDAANLALGSRFLFWLILASPFLGFFYLSSNFLQAAGKAFQATLVSVLRQGVLLIPALYLMHDFFGLTGIAAAHTAADFGAILAASVLGLRGYRQIAAADNLVNTSWKCDSF